MNLLKVSERLSGNLPMYSLLFSVKTLIRLEDGLRVSDSPILKLVMVLGLPGLIRGMILEIPGSSMKLVFD